jgi:hypothetical protein
MQVCWDLTQQSERCVGVQKITGWNLSISIGLPQSRRPDAPCSTIGETLRPRRLSDLDGWSLSSGSEFPFLFWLTFWRSFPLQDIVTLVVCPLFYLENTLLWHHWEPRSWASIGRKYANPRIYFLFYFFNWSHTQWVKACSRCSFDWCSYWLFSTTTFSSIFNWIHFGSLFSQFFLLCVLSRKIIHYLFVEHRCRKKLCLSQNNTWVTEWEKKLVSCIADLLHFLVQRERDIFDKLN